MLLVAAATGASCSSGESARTSVLLITIDTCRDDHVGAPSRRGGPSRTPHLDALGREGRRFPVAIAPSCFTAPSMTSISTGVYPETHAVLQWGIDGAGFGRPGLGARFSAAGYRTAFVSGHGGLGGIVPLLAGFEHVRDMKDAPAADVTRAAVDWLERTRRAHPSSPVFLWVHYFDPHSPYAPPDRSAPGVLGGVPFETWMRETMPRIAEGERIAALEALYAGEIAEVDLAIGDLLPAVKRSLRPEKLVVAVTADHGENLADHEPRFAHHDALFDSLVRVPLFLWGSGVADLRIDGGVPIEIVRLAPTLLDLAGLPHAPGDFDRPSLTRGAGDGFAYCHSGLQEAPHAALRSPTGKVVVEIESAKKVAFDLVADPGETRPLDPDGGEFRSLSVALDLLRRAMPAREKVADAARGLPEDIVRFLQQVGYLGGENARKKGDPREGSAPQK